MMNSLWSSLMENTRCHGVGDRVAKVRFRLRALLPKLFSHYYVKGRYNYTVILTANDDNKYNV